MLAAVGMAMELLARKGIWGMTALFAVLAAFLASRIASDLAQWALRSTATAAAEGSMPGGAAAREEAAPPSREKLARACGLPVPVAGAIDSDPERALPRSPLRLALLGTLLAADPRWSIASIHDLAARTSATYMEGDSVQGAEVLEIERARVILLNGGRREYVDREPGDRAGTPMAALADGLGGGIRELSENRYEVPRSEVDRTLANLGDLAVQVRIVPAVKDGVVRGFIVASIRPDSLLARIGIQNGDLIRRINGYEINSPENALEVYAKLKNASRIDLEVERRGSIVQKTYDIR